MTVIFNLTEYKVSEEMEDIGVIDLDQDLHDEMFERVTDASFKELLNPLMRELVARSVVSKVSAQVKRLAKAEGDKLPEVCLAAMELDKFQSSVFSPNLCRFYGARVILGQQWPWLNGALEKEFAALGISVGYAFYRDIGDEQTEFKGIVWV